MGKAIKQAQEMAAEAAQENTGALPETEGEALDVEAAPAATLEEMEEMDWSQWEADPDDEDAPKPPGGSPTTAARTGPAAKSRRNAPS